MKRVLLTIVVSVLLIAGCLVPPGHRGRGSASGSITFEVPALPTIVVLEEEPYYHHGGYVYFYQGDRWTYSKSKNGPWNELPRDRYPKEVKHKGKPAQSERGEKRGHEK